MNNSPYPFHRTARNSAVALLALALGLTVSAQSGASGSSGSDNNRSGTTGSSGTSGSAAASPGSYGSTNRASTASTTGDDYGTSRASSGSRADKSSLRHGDRRFINKVAESNQKELAMAQLALSKTSNPQIRSYAQQLVSDHEQMNQQLIQLATQKGVVLDNASMAASGGMAGMTGASASGSSNTAGTGMSGSHAAGTSTGGSSGMATNDTGARTSTGMSTSAGSVDVTADRHYRNLQQKSGAEFDKEFISMMVDDHKKDVKLFQKEAQDANDMEVKSFASQHVAALQGHLDRAQSLNRSVAE